MNPPAELLALVRSAVAKHALEFSFVANSQTYLAAVLVCAVAEQESAWDACAIRYEPAFRTRYVAPLGLTPTEEIARSMSWGLMQVMGQVAREHGFAGKFLSALTDPATGLDIGCAVLASKVAAARATVVIPNPVPAPLLGNGGEGSASKSSVGAQHAVPGAGSCLDAAHPAARQIPSSSAPSFAVSAKCGAACRSADIAAENRQAAAGATQAIEQSRNSQGGRSPSSDITNDAEGASTPPKADAEATPQQQASVLEQHCVAARSPSPQLPQSGQGITLDEATITRALQLWNGGANPDYAAQVLARLPHYTAF